MSKRKYLPDDTKDKLSTELDRFLEESKSTEDKQSNLHKYFNIIIDHDHDEVLSKFDKSYVLRILQLMVNDKIKIMYNENDNIYLTVSSFEVIPKFKHFKNPIVILVRCSKLLDVDESKLITTFISNITKNRITEIAESSSKIVQ